MILSVGLCSCCAVNKVLVAEGAVVPVVGSHCRVELLWLSTDEKAHRMLCCCLPLAKSHRK